MSANNTIYYIPFKCRAECEADVHFGMKVLSEKYGEEIPYVIKTGLLTYTNGKMTRVPDCTVKFYIPSPADDSYDGYDPFYVKVPKNDTRIEGDGIQDIIANYWKEAVKPEGIELHVMYETVQTARMYDGERRRIDDD